MTNPPAREASQATPEPVYDPADQQSARALVDHHLRQLGLAVQNVITEDGYGQRVLPEGIGWCQAETLTEAAWPDGTDQCVLVNWYPDAALRRDTRTGIVPAGAEQHWLARLAATADALESQGYVVERNGAPPWIEGADAPTTGHGPDKERQRVPAEDLPAGGIGPIDRTYASDELMPASVGAEVITEADFLAVSDHGPQSTLWSLPGLWAVMNRVVHLVRH